MINHKIVEILEIKTKASYLQTPISIVGYKMKQPFGVLL
jgi:hypothetical protein